MAGRVEYATDLFDAATLGRLAGHFERLLAGALAAPERRVFELVWLGEAERQQTLVEWNDTAQEPLDGALVHEVISAIAGRSPRALAVAWDGGELTYGELERRSNRLAHRLRRLGVGPEVLVGLCCDRTGDAVVGVLGILKAGGAYVPLDPEYPEERLRQTLADCGAPVLVAQERTAGLAAVTGARLVSIDVEEDDHPLPAAAGPENPAYVIYTSGSTGRPKGVVVTHGALARSTRARLSFYREPVEAYLLASSFAFDSSVAGLFWTLWDGGTLVLHRDQSRLNMPDFLATLENRRASHLLCLPSLYSLILEHAHPGQLASLKTVIVAGEACPTALVAQHAARLPAVALVNEYGPTEGTVWSSACALTAAPPSRVVSIGRPIGNVRLHLLDRGLEPVPAGVHGELWIGGASLARGYLGRPDLTAERFLPDPFSGAPGARIYRTGDLMRWLPDGSLDFLGRVDHQIKIRGFRIELGEIEAALTELPGVREAAVVVREDEPGNRRLVAYVAGDVAIEALRRSLRERLPDYMVPAAFVALAALPLTANGKVDRKALPAPDWQGVREGGYVAPRTREEEILADVWARVLRLPRVGVNDNFFELGGDSILSVQIVARARQAGLAFTVKQIFEHQTVAGLARHAVVPEAPVDFPQAGLGVQGFEKLASLLPDPKNVEDVYPLSPAQNGMLFHGLMAPQSGVYVTQVTCTLPADLDRRRFRQAWERLVKRHGVLRTAFLWDGLDEPLQVVRKTVSLHWQDLDWRGLPDEEQKRRLEDLRHRDRHAPLPLTDAPLMRFSQVRLDSGLRFVWTSHHLLLDGWSLPLLVGELGAIYTALREGREPVLSPPRPFRDYIAWLRGQDVSRAEPFWREELEGFTAPNPLGIGHPAGAGGTAGYGEHGIQVSRAVTAQLRALAARHRLALQALTLGAWAVLVSRYSGEDDVVFGSAVSGRPAALPGVETMVGMFINTLPVRVWVDDAEPLDSWLWRLQERQLARQEFEHSPLFQIQRWSEVPAGSPLFETLYVFENYPDAGEDGAGSLGIAGLRTLESTNYPVTLELHVAADKISLHLTSDRARVDEDAAPRLLRHLAALLAGMAGGLERRVGELDLLSPAERHQAIVEWNDTSAPENEALVLDLLAARAAQVPELPAVVVHGQERLSHGALAARSDRLAAHLRDLGVGPDILVALFLERSVDLVVALLAVLKAGGAYLPLETSLPRPRLSFLLDDARPSLLLTRTGLLPVLPEHSRVICLDELPEFACDFGDTGPAPRPAADNLAYVLYTSGSTGHPKGVAVTHRGFANYLLWAVDAYPAGEGRGAPIHSPVSFDLTVTSLFLPLLAGRCVDLVPEEEGVEGLAMALAEGGFGLVKLTPAHLEVLQRLLPPERVAGSAGAFVVGGEALSGEQLDFWREHAPGLRVINEYGPTETVVGCSIHEVPPSVPPAGPVPIGRPIANTRILLLDRRLHPVPVGVPGELYIGGAGVCRGYLRRPGLTAEKLVPDPFGVWGERLYRTGDLARRLPDGTIEFLGRVDHQVKIRGFRIELGEIEAALLAVPGVREAAVTVRGDQSREDRLVAYVAGDVAVEDLRRSLRERLPDYMVPAVFVTIAALPLTANGKVDRKALPAPEQPAAREGYVAPRTREEEVLAGVWAQVLRLPRVGVNDNFFELGGDSILSVQIVSRARQAGLLFTVRQIFEHQTVAGLALHATATEAAASGRAGAGDRGSAAHPDPALVLRAGLRGSPPLQPGPACWSRGSPSPPPPWSAPWPPWWSITTPCACGSMPDHGPCRRTLRPSR